MAKVLWIVFAAACICNASANAAADAHAPAADAHAPAADAHAPAADAHAPAADAHAPAADAHAPAAGAEGHAAEGHGHGHAKTPEQEAYEAEMIYSSLILLCGIGFIMAIYYLVNCTIKGVTDQTWSMISTSVSIFVAVMSYNLTKELFNLAADPLLSEDHGHAAAAEGHARRLGHGAVTGYHVLVNCLAMLFWWVATSVLLICHRGSKLRLCAFGTVCGHILGFAAIDLYGGAIAQLPTFKSGPGMHCVVLLIYVFTIPLVVMPVKFVEKAAMRCADVEEEERKAISEQAKDTSADFFCMGASFLICMIVRGAITVGRTGHGASAHAEGIEHSQQETGLLILAGLVFLVLAGVMRILHNRFKRTGAMTELVNILATTISLTAAWCLLDSGNWFWLHKYSKAGPVMGKIMVALSFSLFFIFAVVAVSWVLTMVAGDIKRLIRGEFLAISLAVGLSWEHLFDQALEEIGEGYEDKTRKALFIAFMTFLLVLIVFPAWAVYMLPQHDKELTKEYEGQSLAPYQACCDCAEEDEYEEEDEVEGLE